MDDTLGQELRKRNYKREAYDWIESVVLALVCMILVFTFIGRQVSVSGQSMEPTLKDSDRLVSSRLFYTPHRGDIVVVTKPNEKNEPLIKRVIAIEGQTIDIDYSAGDVYVDGVLQNEPFINEPTFQDSDVVFPQTIPQGHVFVMGDNRNHSWDSRDSRVGMIDSRYILGKVYLRLAPTNTFGNPDNYWQETSE